MDQQIRVLVVDDEEPHAKAVAESLGRVGYECVVATSGGEALRLIEEQVFDIIITDLIMEGVGGMEVLAKAKRELPDAEVVILTGHSTVKTAVTAMQAGASNYLIKPLDINELRTVADKVSQSQRLQRSNIELQQQLNERFGFEGVIGNSPAMHSVVAQLRQIAPTSATVLITGESGTGKELVAKALHINSPRKNKPFVPLNCAELGENVLESELFGHVKGAFTGADRDRIGRFQHANGGTLFLDEIGDMPMSIQVKLLRVLETGEIVRVGTNDPVKVNVRLISATHRDLADAIAEGKFRQDLYHRLKVVSVKLPPLRERRDDIPLLIDYFLKEFAAAHGKAIRAVTPAVRKVLLALLLAGQRPRAAERHREHGRDGRRRRARHRRPDRGPPAGRVHRQGRRVLRRRHAGRQVARGDRAALHPRDPQADQRQSRGSLPAARHRRADPLPQDQGIPDRLRTRAGGMSLRTRSRRDGAAPRSFRPPTSPSYLMIVEKSTSLIAPSRASMAPSTASSTRSLVGLGQVDAHRVRGAGIADARIFSALVYTVFFFFFTPARTW